MPLPGHIRLNRFLAERGVASRRGADTLIAEGRVSVDGQLAEPGTQVEPRTSEVLVDGRRITNERPPRMVIMLHKPKGFVCTHRDPHASRTIYELLHPDLQKERLVCVGRLDKESEGLIILTNDGDLAQKVSHPRHGVIKRYHIQLDKDFDPAHGAKLVQGITWEGERLHASKVVRDQSPRPEAARRLEIHLNEGRKHEIRRLLYAFGYDVVRLKRVQVGGLVLKGLAKGQWKLLNRGEIDRLFPKDSFR